MPVKTRVIHSNLLDDLKKLDKTPLRKIAERAGNRFIEGVRETILSGDGQPPYSTRAGWFSVTTPYGAKSKFVAYMRQKQATYDRQGRATQHRNKMTKRAAQNRSTVYLPQGYAQFRAIFRGESIRRSPVTFELTGQMMKNLTPKIRVRNSGFEVTSGFKKQKRRYGKLSNEQLRVELDKRGQHAAFAVPESLAKSIADEATERWLDAAMKPQG